MITPRRTRLVRVADLHEFRRAIVSLAAAPDDRADASTSAPSRFVVVPTRGAAAMLSRTLANAGVEPGSALALVTRDELYDALHTRLLEPPRRLGAFERDAMMQAAAHEAAAAVGDLPFRIRPGLVAEILRFYDQLRRQSQSVKRFEELIVDALGGGELDDRGAERLLRQTRFLAETFRGYERRADESHAFDEHRLRDRLLSDASAVPVSHVVVTVPDWIADQAGLYVADFDLLNRLPNLAALDIVSTEGVLASGFHERLDRWWPGLETDADVAPETAPDVARPRLVCPPPSADGAPLWFTHRDREEELIAVARRLAAEPPASYDRAALVFKRPLPYLYLAPDTLGAAGIPYVLGDAMPLATEPSVSALDLALDAIEADFARDAVVALLRTPHFRFATSVDAVSIAALDRALSDARYLGGRERLSTMSNAWSGEPVDTRRMNVRAAAAAALAHVLRAVDELSAFEEERPASEQLRRLVDFLERHLIPLDPAHPQYTRETRARAAVLEILRGMATAHADYHDPAWSAVDLATSVRRWIGEATFVPERAGHGVRLLDDQAARYGEFDDITIVGLIESEWPERSRRNVFYPPTLLKALGWPSENERHGAADARFLDLLTSARSTIELSVFLLDDEAIVSRSVQLDEVPRAKLSTTAREPLTTPRLPDEQLALDGTLPRDANPEAQHWFQLRATRTPPDDPAFHGTAGAPPERPWSVSALETYLGCPFKFFAQHVLRLEEDPDDEEVMDPRRQGQFVHEVFERFFHEWQEAGHSEVTPAKLPAARELFVQVVDRALASVPEGEAALERTRLLGSPAAAGLGEAVFRMEAERPTRVVARLLEHKLDGPITIATADGPRRVSIRGKADRLDLLADGTFRLIDYKLGWPPDRSRALQLPIYAICAEQQLDVQGRRWTLGEAAYLAFKGPRRVVPLFGNDSSRADTLSRAQQRLADTIDAVERGEFPPTPDDVYRCETCSFASVCRKDYVGDL